jgi:predicted nuclease of predicted toxin-antitoxin system
MKIKLDENLPVKLKPLLASLGHDVETVRDEGLSGKSDREVWEVACAEKCFFVTMDTDFTDLRRFPPGTHAGILVARLSEEEQWRVTEFIQAWFCGSEVEEWFGCLVIGTPSRLRVRRPGKD